MSLSDDLQVLEYIEVKEPQPFTRRTDIVLRKMREVLRDPGAGARELAAVIARDRGVADEVLRMANEAYGRREGPIHDLTRAILLIGFSGISRALPLMPFRRR